MNTHRISWIGLGNIGKPLCRNLAKYGPSQTPISVWNRTHETALALAAESDNIIVVNSIQEAVLSGDIICLCLLDDAAVEDVITAAIQVANVQDKLFVDFSTIHPNTTESQCTRLQSEGAEYLASPVFGGAPLAVNREVTLVLAGSAEAIKKFRPFTDNVICKDTIILTDCTCQQASLLKLIGNFIRFSTIEVLCEASVLAEKAGLPPDALIKFAETCIPGHAAAQLRNLQSGDYHKVTKPAIPIRMAVKENSHLCDLARIYGIRLRTLDTVAGHVNNLEKSRGQNASLLAIFGIIREECGLPFQN